VIDCHDYLFAQAAAWLLMLPHFSLLRPISTVWTRTVCYCVYGPGNYTKAGYGQLLARFQYQPRVIAHTASHMFVGRCWLCSLRKVSFDPWVVTIGRLAQLWRSRIWNREVGAAAERTSPWHYVK